MNFVNYGINKQKNMRDVTLKKNETGKNNENGEFNELKNNKKGKRGKEGSG